MGRNHDHQFPGESEEYRKARDELLVAETNLRKQIEDVARQRRELPLGGMLKEDYQFEEGAANLSDKKAVRQTRFSELFQNDKHSLIIYSFMYGPDWEQPCPMCTSILDSLNGTAPHLLERVNFVVVAKAPLDKIRHWARARGWNNLRLLSSANNTYNSDYFAESSDDDQIPALNVFNIINGEIYHSWNAELLYTPAEENQNNRHVDLIWPLWNMFDLTNEGRGTDWYPKLSYD